MDDDTTRAHDTGRREREDHKPGAPPSSATEPADAERTTPKPDTMTDPHTGEPNRPG